MKLSIDTSDIKLVTVSLEYEGKITSQSSVPDRRTQDVLPFIEKLLQDQAKKLSDLTEICVVSGPGSYTGLRVGIAIANTLGALLKIPINGLPVGQLVKPQYS